MKNKYVRTNYGVTLFSDLEQHIDIARAMYGDAVSAGFCSISIENNQFKVKAWGKSVSLGINSIPEEDEKHLKALLYGCKVYELNLFE